VTTTAVWKEQRRREIRDRIEKAVLLLIIVAMFTFGSVMFAAGVWVAAGKW
jgi:hypothetical protein